MEIRAEAILRELAARLSEAAPQFQWTIAGNKVENWLNIYDRARLVTATEPVAGSVQLTMRDDQDRALVFVVQTKADLDRAWREIGPRVIWWAGRLTMWRLQPHHTYAVIRDSRMIAAAISRRATL